jgi:hypothetical protein
VVIEMLSLLVHYVETSCKQDVGILLSSGFDLAPAPRTSPQPLEPAAIKTIAHGNTGQLLVKLGAVRRARSYEVRFAPVDPDGTPRQWTFQQVVGTTAPVTCAGLTPGSTYTFQVRALGRLGFTDWSQPVAKMCT